MYFTFSDSKSKKYIYFSLFYQIFNEIKKKTLEVYFRINYNRSKEERSEEWEVKMLFKNHLKNLSSNSLLHSAFQLQHIWAQRSTQTKLNSQKLLHKIINTASLLYHQNIKFSWFSFEKHFINISTFLWNSLNKPKRTDSLLNQQQRNIE